jgi:hypothetical protein
MSQNYTLKTPWTTSVQRKSNMTWTCFINNKFHLYLKVFLCRRWQMEANKPVGPPYAGRPTCLWTHQAFLRWQDPCEVSQSHSLPLDHTCVLSQGWRMKSHGFIGPQRSIQRDKNSQHTPWHVGTPSRRKWWGLATIGRSTDLPMDVPALHRLLYTFNTCQMTLALGFKAVLYGSGSNGCMTKVTRITDITLLHLHL